MCAIFGFMDYRNNVEHGVMKKLLQRIANAAEERGTDATGIGYINNCKFTIQKDAKPAHKMKLDFPKGTKAVLGHTRWTTQGSESYNYNNHPFESTDGKFIMAHNGVIRNDEELREDYNLPETHIQTDSYIAVQLAESKGLCFDTLKFVAEELIGTFVLTYLDNKENFYIVKGDNPLYLVHFYDIGLYVYTSTKSIFYSAIKGTVFEKMRMEHIEVDDGEIIKIANNGNIEYDNFKIDYRYDDYNSFYDYDDDIVYCDYSNDGSLKILLKSAESVDFSSDEVIAFLDYGLDVFEIEENLHSKEGIEYLKEVLNYMEVNVYRQRIKK